MKKLLIAILFIFSVQAQTSIYLPIILKSGSMAIDPKIIITDGTIEVDLLQDWKLADPYWNPKISQYKGGGTFVNAQLAEGKRMIHREYDNVIETIPLSLRGANQAQAMAKANEALGLLRQAGDYWTEPYEYDPVWIEVKLPCNACLTGYSRVIKGTIPELTNPFGQPFFSGYSDAVMEGITLTIEREPFWQITKPGEIIGPLYNLIDNPDFELWNFGVEDSQPDSWTDLETTHIAGQNSRDQSLPKFGNSALKIRVSGSTLAGASKGITQVISDTEGGVEYTVIAWVRSEGVSNGVGRILINYASQLELYRDSASHGWTLYTGKITTGAIDTVSINCEILTTAANTDGTIYIDGLMFIKGDWEQEAIDNVLPYMSGSHIVNHWDQPSGLIEAGDINYVDAWNVPGNVDALVRLEVVNDTSPSDFLDITEAYSVMRIGQRRTKNIFKFDNYNDPEGQEDATASSDDRVAKSLNTDYKTISISAISGPDITENNQGRFRLLARVYDNASTPNSSVRVKYFVGASNTNLKALSEETVPISQNWTIVDLTKDRALVLSRKFSNNPPGQLGYLLEAKRSSGTDDLYFDYSMLMPTDGGYIEATITPSLTLSNALIIDNTGALPLAGATFRRSGWNHEFNITAERNITFSALKEWQGFMYLGGKTRETFADNSIAKIWRRAVNTWELVFSLDVGSNNFQVTSFAEYDGVLYAGISDFDTTEARIISSEDGENWSTFLEFTLGGRVEAMESFDGRLWYSEPGISTISYYDGSSHTSPGFDILPSGSNCVSLKIYKNTLYASFLDVVGGADNAVYVWNEGANQWQESLNEGSGTNFYELEVFDGKLVLGTFSGGGGRIKIFDGETWETAFITTGAARNTYFLKSFDGRLYAESVLQFLAPEDIWVTDDLETWELTYSAPPFENSNTRGVLEGGISGLTLATSTGFSSVVRGDIYVLADSDIIYNVPNFSGSPFYAPPRKSDTNLKRHRYFFSYDREDFINNIDDKALVGIGFVPRYLELPMKEN